MARRVRDDLFYADMEARRYVNSQLAECKKLGYPRQAAFANHIARGTISLAPTPEDEFLERVGRFAWGLKETDRKVLFAYYGDPESPYIKARRLGITVSRFQRMRERILYELNGYLSAKRDL